MGMGLVYSIEYNFFLIFLFCRVELPPSELNLSQNLGRSLLSLSLPHNKAGNFQVKNVFELELKTTLPTIPPSLSQRSLAG